MDLSERYRRLHGDAAQARAELDRIRTAGREVVIVSACLLGVRCRYDAGDRESPAAVAAFTRAADGKQAEIVPLCPEILAGLGVPRPPLALTANARALDPAGRDFTAELEAGAARADAMAELAGATRALLKERSPSCGVHRVHTLTGLVSGQGRFAARLRARHCTLASEED